MSWTSFFLYLSFCSAVSVGCKEPSSIDGYCLSCLEGYDSSDNTCNTCKVLDPYTEPSDTNPIYLQSINGSCYDATKYYSKEITYYSINYTNTITIQPTDIKLYKSPCYSMTTNTQPYYFGFWLELKNQKGTFEPLSVSISWNVNGFQMAVECGGECDSYGETYKNETTFYTYSGKNDTCYIFVSTYYEVTEMASVTVLLSSDNEEIFEEFDVDFIKELNSSGLTHNFYLPFKESGFYTTPVCVPSRMLKAINIDIEVPKGLNVYIKGNEAKYRYVQQYYFSNGKRVCDLLKTSQIEGEIYSVGKDQYVSTLLTYDDTYFDSFTKTKRISSIDEPTQWRHLTILTIDDSANDSFSISIICPEGCNQDNQQGSCSIQTGKCCCKYGYFGKACRLPCYNPINNSFNEIYGDQDQLCYMGTKNCDDDCVCNSGYKVDGHMCISLACLNEESSVDCFSGSVHCEKNCSCSYGYVPLSTTSPQSGCKLETCGNNKVDDNEECDGGVGCHINCSCYSGYEPSTIQQGSCQEVPFAAWKIITLVFVGLFLIVLSLIIPLLALFIVLKRKVVDKNVFVQQQPTYYYDITQSQVIFKESKCSITPIKLDFGNGNNPTKIFDTRFEELELKNKSRKWMMVIFHTPNSPKYIFHFKPQVLFIKPRSARVATVYMTLNCTTRILGTRLHFSVYHSEKMDTLKKIESILKNKTFVEWNDDCRDEMSFLMKNVKYKYHGALEVKTEAVNSVHIDMDEIQFFDDVIGEGANGKVYLGKYRGVFVAVKKYKWEHLTHQESIELRKDIIRECDLMNKLRNIYIANFVGSVTHLQEISMVSVFFELGCLSDYIRKDNEFGVLLPYRLKCKIISDVSHGMQFLHENDILHLDFKPGNLLVNSLSIDSSATSVKITDFGTSRLKQKVNKGKGLGTPVYMAPEANIDLYSSACDVYSFAITAWELYYAEEPFKEAKTLFDVREIVESGERPPIDGHIPPLYKSLIEACWKQDFSKRLKFAEITPKCMRIKNEAENNDDMEFGIGTENLEGVVRQRKDRTLML